ncbi:hypothetical protein JZK55_07960 [Dissulfurispira thermophila]|uniref:Uncharacterized protein n=2 Tax=root TaxID=1 RepID=A0A7G1GZQ7_9BACT|nr:type II toxin-antitoxin system VapB family antitoxin [Dissulfurispira thermophila]BCB95874.1 hypothetical protein JZK55_07960 [Dissulfurispira thermophila]
MDRDKLKAALENGYVEWQRHALERIIERGISRKAVKENIMPTNLAIDEKLLNEALKVSGHKTKKNTVNEALKEFIQRRKQKDILSLFGKD